MFNKQLFLALDSLFKLQRAEDLLESIGLSLNQVIDNTEGNVGDCICSSSDNLIYLVSDMLGILPDSKQGDSLNGRIIYGNESGDKIKDIFIDLKNLAPFNIDDINILKNGLLVLIEENEDSWDFNIWKPESDEKFLKPGEFYSGGNLRKSNFPMASDAFNQIKMDYDKGIK